jgi:predicted polyphosphate/ATP-dependent NAD kinase
LDAGWVNTYDSIYHSTGKFILSSVFDELYNDKDLRFNYGDIAFLNRWWSDSDEDTRKKVKEVVDRG